MVKPFLFKIGMRSRQPDPYRLYFLNATDQKIVITRQMLQENHGQLPDGVHLHVEFDCQKPEVKTWPDGYRFSEVDIYMDDKGELNPYHMEAFSDSSDAADVWQFIDALSLFIVNEQVYQDICEAKELGLLKIEWDAVLPLHLSPFDKGLRRRKGNIPLPHYYAMVLKQGVENMEMAPVEEKARVKEKYFPVLCVILREKTWDQTDLFKMPYSAFGCSIRFIELAREKKWHDFIFEPERMILLNPGCLWPGIPYNGQVWPPKSWYPPGLNPEILNPFKDVN